MRKSGKFVLLLMAIALCQSGVFAANQKEAYVDKPDLSFLEKPEEKTPLLPDEINNIKVYKLCSKAVVNIATVATPEGYYYNIVPQEGIDSGTIISADGYIITNEHVVGNNNMVRVTLFDGSSYAAKLVGKDSSNDLAVLKIQAPKGKTFQYIQIGDSSELAVGRRVLAIGNPFGYDQTMTQGMVSSLGRTLKTRNHRMIKGIIQTDAAINPGNSGGPLLDTSGKLVGLNTAIFTRAGQNAGIGLAIPANIIRTIVPDLILYHKVIRPDLGILAMQETINGVRVVKLDPQGPALTAGLQGPQWSLYQMGPFTMRGLNFSSADLITHIDNIKVENPDELLSYVEKQNPDQVVTLTVSRGGTILKIPVKLTVNR